MKHLLFLLIFSAFWQTYPSLYDGRLHPHDTAAKLWVEDLLDHSQTPETLPSFDTFVYLLELEPHWAFTNLRLHKLTQKQQEDLGSVDSFVTTRTLEKLLFALPPSQRKTHQELTHRLERIHLLSQGIKPLEHSSNPVPLLEKLRGPLCCLPLKAHNSYAPLKLLLLNTTQNHTTLDDSSFQTLQALTQKLSKSLRENPTGPHPLIETLDQALKTHLPLSWQVLLESFYIKQNIPFCVAALLFLAVLIPAQNLYIAALILQILLITLRCLILARPPITSMYETYFFVSLIATLAAMPLPQPLRNRSLVIPLFLYLIALLSYPHHQFTPLQPVLNSNFWLTTHVTLVVGSYGLFLLLGFYAHILLFNNSQRPSPSFRYSLYIATFTLIFGTLLGALWAHQSWGRFWDWDPKESWAFISICIFLILIHLERTQRLTPYGLYLGTILGLLSITFCWYGVNYIIGTGLHAYGFGSGGLAFYATYLAIEALFLTFFLTIKRQERTILSARRRPPRKT